jgi:hypothetical protein
MSNLYGTIRVIFGSIRTGREWSGTGGRTVVTVRLAGRGHLCHHAKGVQRGAFTRTLQFTTVPASNSE